MFPHNMSNNGLSVLVAVNGLNVQAPRLFTISREFIDYLVHSINIRLIYKEPSTKMQHPCLWENCILMPRGKSSRGGGSMRKPFAHPIEKAIKDKCWANIFPHV
jgi:hypothetical protein